MKDWSYVTFHPLLSIYHSLPVTLTPSSTLCLSPSLTILHSSTSTRHSPHVTLFYPSFSIRQSPPDNLQRPLFTCHSQSGTDHLCQSPPIILCLLLSVYSSPLVNHYPSLLIATHYPSNFISHSPISALCPTFSNQHSPFVVFYISLSAGHSPPISLQPHHSRNHIIHVIT